MLEEQLVQYGVFGIWTVFNIGLIYLQRQDNKQMNEKLINVIENNNLLIGEVKSTLDKCKKNA